jgi:hypothetical protein
MGFAQWMRVFDALTGLAQLTGRLRGNVPDVTGGLPATGGPLGQLEARLAGVVVAALKEAFDRDSARMELERSQIDAERNRAEQALRAELRRQAAERSLGQLRLVSVMAVGTWALSAALGAWLPGMREGLPRMMLGSGWAFAIAALGCAFAGWQKVSAWTADPPSAAATAPQHRVADLAPWLLITALALTAVSLLVAL